MTRTFALIPAGGSGARMGLALPKQYAPLAGVPMITHCLRTLLALPQIEKIFVVIAPDDTHWAHHCAALEGPRLQALPVGGATRAQSVAQGLAAITGQLAEDDWVMVHDAARACLAPDHVLRLMAAVGDSSVGGLLAMPLADTLKRANEAGAVSATLPREGLWQAQTPQLFRFGLLRRALQAAPNVTDESSAIEALGLSPLLVESDAGNFKVTRPFDLQLAQWVLQHRNLQHDK